MLIKFTVNHILGLRLLVSDLRHRASHEKGQAAKAPCRT